MNGGEGGWLGVGTESAWHPHHDALSLPILNARRRHPRRRAIPPAG